MAYKNRNVVLTALEAGKSKIKALADVMSDEGLIDGHILTLQPYVEEGSWDLSGIPFM